MLLPLDNKTQGDTRAAVTVANCSLFAEAERVAGLAVREGDLERQPLASDRVQYLLPMRRRLKGVIALEQSPLAQRASGTT